MASPKITASDLAPAEAVHYTFAGVEFDIGGSGRKTFETNDPTVVSNAESHPWLQVEYPKVELVAGSYREQVAPQDDPFTLIGRTQDPNDPDAVREAEEAKSVDFGQPVVLEAGTAQTEVVVTDGVAETLAAVDADDDSTDSDKKKD